MGYILNVFLVNVRFIKRMVELFLGKTFHNCRLNYLLFLINMVRRNVKKYRLKYIFVPLCITRKFYDVINYQILNKFKL